MIIVKLQGGLGNQLFQAATAFALAKHYHTKLKLDLSFLQKNNVSTETFTARGYELDVFNHKFEFADENEIDFFFPKNNNFYKRIIRKAKRTLLKPQIIKEEWSPDDFLIKTSKFSYLDGYWQSEKYFKKYGQEIRDIFQFPDIEAVNKSISDEIGNQNSVSIHFRRGDFVHNNHIKLVHGICDFKYYENAINYVSSIENNIKLYVFSDEPAWVKNNFKTNLKFEIVDTNSSIVDMYLMSLCKHSIIANSSFSWWAAWLNKSQNKIVIAPKKWFANEKRNKQIKDLIPENWKQI